MDLVRRVNGLQDQYHIQWDVIHSRIPQTTYKKNPLTMRCTGLLSAST